MNLKVEAVRRQARRRLGNQVGPCLISGIGDGRIEKEQELIGAAVDGRRLPEGQAHAYGPLHTHSRGLHSFIDQQIDEARPAGMRPDVRVQEAPEHFVRVRSADPMKRKQLKKGLEELSDEGAVLLLFDRDENDPEPILGTVGPLQFDVVQYRLKSEYGVAAIFERMPYNYARWVEESETHKLSPEEVVRRGSIACVYDVERRPILLFDTEWVMHRTQEKLQGLTFIAAAQPGRRQHGKR